MAGRSRAAAAKSKNMRNHALARRRNAHQQFVSCSAPAEESFVDLTASDGVDVDIDGPTESTDMQPVNETPLNNIILHQVEQIMEGVPLPEALESIAVLASMFTHHDAPSEKLIVEQYQETELVEEIVAEDVDEDIVDSDDDSDEMEEYLSRFKPDATKYSLPGEGRSTQFAKRANEREWLEYVQDNCQTEIRGMAQWLAGRRNDDDSDSDDEEFELEQIDAGGDCLSVKQAYRKLVEKASTVSKVAIKTSKHLVLQETGVLRYFFYRLRGMKKMPASLEAAKGTYVAVDKSTKQRELKEMKASSYKCTCIRVWAQYYLRHQKFPECVQGRHPKTFSIIFDEDAKTRMNNCLLGMKKEERTPEKFCAELNTRLLALIPRAPDKICVETARRWMFVLGST
jgi:hypothetical protein